MYELEGRGFERQLDRVRSPDKTIGRFSIRGPAAWRKDGGSGKKQ